MTVLKAKVSWKRESARRRMLDLTPDEQANVRAALVFLHRRFGSWEALAKAMNAKPHTVITTATHAKVIPSAGMALRTSRAAGVPMEDVLAGRWPPKGLCPLCGHVTEAQ